MNEANLHIDMERDWMSVREARQKFGVFQLEDDAAAYGLRSKRLDRFLQVAIAALTLASLALITSESMYSRWGFVLGLASQPFYIAATWRARQWGMLGVAIVLIGVWLRGVANTFF